jgi:uncharacterized protein YihD (DUF1040 family)
MRSEARIDKILDKLRSVWQNTPDSRLCQLIVNITGGKADLFYMDDDKFFEKLCEFEKVMNWWKRVSGAEK